MVAPWRAWLARPYRPVHVEAGSVTLAVLFGLFVFLFLWVFEPFGLGFLGPKLWRVALVYGGLCTGVMLMLNGLVPQLVPAFFREDRWNVGREIAWSLVNVGCIGLANVAYTRALGGVHFTLGTVLWFELFTLLIGAFPVVVVVLWNELRLSRRYSAEAERVNATLPAPPDPGPNTALAPAGEVVIPSESGREDLALARADLLFLRSASNYVEVHRLEQGRPTRTVIRCSLKRAEEALAQHPRLVRCHKSHLVNLDRVVRVSGNAQGYRLHLGEGLPEVPVSRQWNGRIQALLAVRP